MGGAGVCVCERERDKGGGGLMRVSIYYAASNEPLGVIAPE
jgi:hypothetical protein